jgi:hypothetical protein
MPSTKPLTSLTPFAQNAACPKCGADTRVVIYLNDTAGERLASTCTCCSFSWENACLDSSKGSPMDRTGQTSRRTHTRAAKAKTPRPAE